MKKLKIRAEKRHIFACRKQNKPHIEAKGTYL